MTDLQTELAALIADMSMEWGYNMRGWDVDRLAEWLASAFERVGWCGYSRQTGGFGFYAGKQLLGQEPVYRFARPAHSEEG